MSIVSYLPFDSDDNLFPDGHDDFSSHSDSGTHDWDSQHHDYDHSNDDHLHTFDSDHHDSYFGNDPIHQADDWHLQTPDSDDAHSTMLGDADDHTGYLVHQNFDPVHQDGIVVGDPGHDMDCWHHQNHPDDCAVVAQQSVLESLTGQHFSEDGLCTEAMVDGCYHPGGGTPADHVGHVLEEHGIPVEHHYGGTLSDLNDRLSHGEKVIVAVNSQEIWSPDRGSVFGQSLNQYPGIPGQAADHAVVVTGIVYPKSDPLHPQVVLNDSGTPNGQGMMVPLEQFEKAWASSDHYMVATAVHSNHNIEQDNDASHPLMLGSTDYHHYHHLVKPKSPYESSDSDSSNSNSTSSSSSDDDHYDEVFPENGGFDPNPSEGGGGGCLDSDGDGQCDAGGGNGGDGRSSD
jgi:hypothetical protein